MIIVNIVNYKVTRNATILVLSQTLVSALNYSFWIVLARIAILEVNGGVATILSILTIFTFFMQPGIPMATSKYISEYLSRKNTNMIRTTIKYSIILIFTLSSIAAVLLVLLVERIAGIYNFSGFTTPLRVSALLVAMIPLQGVISGIYQGFQKMEYCFLQALLVASSKFFLGLGLVLFGLGVIGPVLGMIFGGLCVIFLAFFFISGLLRQTLFLQSKPSETNPEGGLFKWTDLIRLGVPNSIIFGLIKLSSQAGTLILGFFGGSMENVAWYYLSLQIVLGITLISQALGFAILPAVSAAWVNKSINEFKSTLNLCFRYFFVFIGPIVMITFFFPEEILRLILGKDYLPAAPMLRILLLAIPAIGTLQIFVSVLTGIGSTKWLMRFSLIILFIYFFLAVWLTSVSGLIGTSGAFTCSIAIGALTAYWMTQKATKIHIDLLILAKIFVPSILLLLLTKILTSLSLGILLALSLGLAIYVILSFVVGTFTSEDVAFIKNLLQMLIGKQRLKND